eukprot:1160246-Pelagomonas_calceolata.AAC.1
MSTALQASWNSCKLLTRSMEFNKNKLKYATGPLFFCLKLKAVHQLICHPIVFLRASNSIFQLLDRSRHMQACVKAKHFQGEKGCRRHHDKGSCPCLCVKKDTPHGPRGRPLPLAQYYILCSTVVSFAYAHTHIIHKCRAQLGSWLPLATLLGPCPGRCARQRIGFRGPCEAAQPSPQGSANPRGQSCRRWTRLLILLTVHPSSVNVPRLEVRYSKKQASFKPHGQTKSTKTAWEADWQVRQQATCMTANQVNIGACMQQVTWSNKPPA